MSNFVQVTEHDVHIYAKIQCMNVHRFLYIFSSSFAFWEFYAMQYCSKVGLVKITEEICSKGFP
jgi:hypothetical protein